MHNTCARVTCVVRSRGVSVSSSARPVLGPHDVFPPGGFLWEHLVPLSADFWLLSSCGGFTGGTRWSSGTGRGRSVLDRPRFEAEGRRLVVDEAKPNAFGDAAVVEGPDALLLDSRDDGVFEQALFLRACATSDFFCVGCRVQEIGFHASSFSFAVSWGSSLLKWAHDFSLEFSW